jgi:hypothetical protein
LNLTEWPGPELRLLRLHGSVGAREIMIMTSLRVQVRRAESVMARNGLNRHVTVTFKAPRLVTRFSMENPVADSEWYILLASAGVSNHN